VEGVGLPDMGRLTKQWRATCGTDASSLTHKLSDHWPTVTLGGKETMEQSESNEAAGRASGSLERLVRPHVGTSSNRLRPDADNPREVAFAMEWTRAQVESRQLARLLGNNFSDRDAEVAATVIQWLGSNVGMCFLEEAIKREPKIKEWLAARIVWPNEKGQP